MQLLEESMMAALAAIGLLTVVFAVLSALLHPRRGELPDAFAVIPCRAGDAQRLERAVRALERLRYEHGVFRRIVIWDCGMDAETEQMAALLCRDGFDISVCREAWQAEWE